MNRDTAFSHIKIRFVVILVIVIAAGVLLAGTIVSAKSSESEREVYKYYTSIQIEPGDTLWDIAERYCEYPGEEKAYVEELKQINNLSGEDIHAGRYLTIIYYSEEYK